MKAGVGVNSAEYLQKKIERLKIALDEANVLMDRQVTERDEARAQLDVAKRENQELTQQLEARQAQVGADGGAAEEAGGLDPELEQSLRDRIAQLEGERDSLQAAPAPDDQALRDRIDQLERERESIQAAPSDGDQELREHVESLRGELETA